MKNLVILACVILEIGCRSQGRPDAHTLVVGLSGRPTTLDPRQATDADSQRIDDLLFAALVRNGNDLKPVPEAATSWKTEKNKITFTLRDDLHFHNGRSLTARDVVYSLNEYMKPSSPCASALSEISSVEAPDAKTIVINLKHDDAPLLSNLTLVKIIAKEDVENLGDRFAEHPSGSGPYRFISENNNELRLKKFDGAPYATPQLENLIFKFVRDDNTRYLKMIKGDLDVLLNEVQEEKIASLRQTPDINIMVTPGLNFNYLLLNLKLDKFKDRPFRQALFSSIDRDEIIKYKLDGLAAKATSIIAPASQFSDPDLKLKKLSLPEAKKIIHDLGMTGVEISLKASAQAEADAQILAEQVGRLGLRINLQTLDWGTFYSDVKTGRFEVALMRWVGIIDPDVYRDTLSSHEFPPGRNRGYYSNKEFDALIEQARRETNDKKRQALYFKAEQMIADDLPILPLWYNDNISVLNKRVKNFSPAITGSFYPLIEVTKGP